MSERDFRAELETGRCNPNHGCNVCRVCMCVLAEEAIDDNDRLRARVAELEAGLIEAEDRIATALVGGICEQCVEVALANIRIVLAKGPSTSAQDEGAA